MTLAVREASPADLDRLDALERAAFGEPWSRAQLDGHLANPHALTLIGQAGDAAAIDAEPPPSYAALLLVACEAELLRIAVLPAARRRGLARGLLREALEALRRRGIPTCYLEVREDNEPAIALYAGLGFTRVGRRAGYYRDGTAALLYRRDL